MKNVTLWRSNYIYQQMDIKCIKLRVIYIHNVSYIHVFRRMFALFRETIIQMYSCKYRINDFLILYLYKFLRFIVSLKMANIRRNTHERLCKHITYNLVPYFVYFVFVGIYSELQTQCTERILLPLMNIQDCKWCTPWRTRYYTGSTKALHNSNTSRGFPV